MTSPFAARLRLATLAVCAIVWTSLGAALLGPDAGGLVMPGPLSSSHALLAPRCASCHTAGGSIKGPLHGLVTSRAAIEDSGLCLGCHAMGGNALEPHTEARAVLASTTDRRRATAGDALSPARGQLLASLTGGAPRSAGGQLACATCHREHRGRASDLTSLSDDACEACHVDRDDHFPDRHPGFTSYPYGRRTRVVFDHQRHRQRHFPDGAVRFACDGCHRLDPTGSHVLTGDFAAGCTGCHDHLVGIRGGNRVEAGIPLLRLPGLDLEALTGAGLALADWPAAAADEYDAAPAALAEVLLAGDPDYPRFAEDRRLLAALDLADLADAADLELAAAARYARALARLLDELAGDPRATVRRRLSRPAAAEAALVATIAERWSTAATREVQRAWLPAAVPAGEVAAGTRREWSGGGRWYEGDDDYTLYYAPQRHADPFLRAWLDLTAARAAEPVYAAAADYLEVEEGRCTKCHSIDVDSTGERRIHWRGEQPEPSHGLTRVAHAPHVLMAGEAGCERCHRLGDSEPYLASYRPARAAGSFTPEFQAMQVDTCAGCHSSRGAGAGCTTCHRYHVGVPVTLAGERPLGLTGSGLTGSGLTGSTPGRAAASAVRARRARSGGT